MRREKIFGMLILAMMLMFQTSLMTIIKIYILYNKEKEMNAVIGLFALIVVALVGWAIASLPFINVTS